MPENIALGINDIATLLTEERAEQLSRDPVPCDLAIIRFMDELDCLSAPQALWLSDHCALGIPSHVRMSCLLRNGMFMSRCSLG